jgi:hypothetical protein
MLTRNSKPDINLSPFSVAHLRGEGIKSEQHTQAEQPENNRHRHFREYANCCELVSGAAINATISFFFRAAGVDAAGWFVALVVTHCYFTATAASDQRRRINHIMTGVSSGASAIATFWEPVSDWVEMQSGLREYHNELDRLQPKPDADYSGWGIGILILILAIGLLAANKGRNRTWR